MALSISGGQVLNRNVFHDLAPDPAIVNFAGIQDLTPPAQDNNRAAKRCTHAVPTLKVRSASVKPTGVIPDASFSHAVIDWVRTA